MTNDPQQSRPNPEFIDAPNNEGAPASHTLSADAAQTGVPSRPNLSEGATYTDDTPDAKDDAKRVAADASDRAKGVAGTAQGEAQNVADTAKQAGGAVAGTAKDEAKQVYGEALTQGKQLLSQGVDEARGHAGTAQNQIAGFVRSISDELSSLSRGASQSGPVLELVEQAERIGNDAATWLENNEPDDVLDTVRTYAARNPWKFLAISAGVGFVASRLVHGLNRDDSQDFESQPLGRQVSAPHAQGQQMAAPSYSNDEQRAAQPGGDVR